MKNKKLLDGELPFTFIRPRDVIKAKNLSQSYYMTTMLNRLQQVFKWGNLPDTIPQRFLENYLLTSGSACITLVPPGRNEDGTERSDASLYAFSGAFGGYRDAYYFPRSFFVNNPYLNFNRELEIDTDCVIIANDSYYYGLYPLLCRYSQILTELDITALNISVLLRAPFGLTARDDTERKSAEQFLKRLEQGELAILAENLVFEGVNSLNLLSQSSNGISQSLIELRQYYYGSLFNEIGINANFNLKRESINSTETDLNRDALFPLIDDMLMQRKRACEKLNEKYGTDITVDLNSAWKDEQREQDAILDNLETVEKDVTDNADIGFKKDGRNNADEGVSRH